jgi:hypothetical protein
MDTHMPLNLHAGCRKRLVETLTAGLPAVWTNNGMFLDRGSLIVGVFQAEEVLPKAGALRERLISYVDDFPIIEFVSETLAVELWERDEYLSDTPSVRLVELNGYTDAGEVAHALVEKFESLPWQYALTIQLPTALTELLSHFILDFPLSNNLRLVRGR